MKRWYLLVTLLVLLSALTACVAPAAPAAAPESGAAASAPEAPAAAPARTRLVVAAPLMADNLDAHQSYGGGAADMEQVGQALARIDSATGALIPDLAESLTFSDDGTVLTVKLPADAKFSNGDPLDAQALKDSWLRYKEISPYGADLEALVDIQVIDATTMQATFNAPPAPLFAVLETSYGGAWNIAKATEMGNEAFALAPIASGPFAVKEFTPSSDLLMVRNENYQTNLPFVDNKGPAYLTEVQVRAISEEMTIAGELETGAVDIIINTPSAALDRMRANPDIQIFEVASPGYTGLVMNHQSPFFSDVQVRQAVAQAVDRDALVKVLGDVTSAQYAFINQSMIGYSADADSYAQTRYPYNVEAAKAALAGAGWTDSDGDGILDKDGQPFSVALMVSAVNSDAQLAGQVLQGQLKAIGIDLQIDQQDPRTGREAMVAGDFDMGFDVVAWRDADIFSLVFAAPFWNFAKYDNPVSVEKMDAARHFLDPTERGAAYAELQKMWLDDVVELPLWQYKRFMAARTWVKGLIVNPTTGALFLNDVTIEE